MTLYNADKPELPTFEASTSSPNILKYLGDIDIFLSQFEVRLTKQQHDLMNDVLMNCHEMIDYLNNKLLKRMSFTPEKKTIDQIETKLKTLSQELTSGPKEFSGNGEHIVKKVDSELSEIVQLFLEEVKTAHRKSFPGKPESLPTLPDDMAHDRLGEMQRELQAKMRQALEQRKSHANQPKVSPEHRVYEEMPYEVVIQRKGLDANHLEVAGLI